LVDVAGLARYREMLVTSQSLRRIARPEVWPRLKRKALVSHRARSRASTWNARESTADVPVEVRQADGVARREVGNHRASPSVKPTRERRLIAEGSIPA